MLCIHFVSGVTMKKTVFLTLLISFLFFNIFANSHSFVKDVVDFENIESSKLVSDLSLNDTDSVEKNSDEYEKFIFDLGTEPGDSASTTYGMFQYNWNVKFGSAIRLKYSNFSEMLDDIEGYTNATLVNKSKEFDFDVLPFIYKKNNFNIGLGFSYQFINEKSFAGMFDTNGYMLNPEDIGKYFTMENKKIAHILAPRIDFNTRTPVSKIFIFNFDVCLNPFYFMNLEQSMNYHSDHTVSTFDYSGNNNVTRWSSPYINLKISADLFNFVRIVSQLSYQNLTFQQMDWASDFESLIGYDDNQKITNLRFGLDFLVGNKLKSRAKGGIYYENNWNYSSYLDKLNIIVNGYLV